MFNLIRKIMGKPAIDFQGIVRDGAVILDVRNANEFENGHAENAINIPFIT